MLAQIRRNQLIHILKEEHKIIVKDAARLLQVSEGTLRSDLKILEEDGLLVRTHGGAVPIKPSTESPFNERKLVNLPQKAAIGQAAVQLIDNSYCVILDASSTSLEMARCLAATTNLTVITNGLATAQMLAQNIQINVIVTGGVVRPASTEIEGLLGKAVLSQIHADIFFTSAHGLSIEHGLTEFSFQEAELKKAMAANATKVVALIDSSKLNRRSLATSVDFPKIHTLITDSAADPAFLASLRDRHIEVIVVQPITQAMRE
ncbi:DeoR/GlpR family DNA-binding transcription regulator [Paenibacillus agricola]|uniref:DeoR/GlpR transcriptional regulator n=1 Tax=Paenibacillus agricola TaxID=2716264 RepID=A0ABX0J9E0_9BACL|nr:DeoR/GlpR family DNA-binding transcription regulator [Paenibacillus agricola]NHN31819.1 DeoR/GlpR transcriptional regulator [Paenibacillus agricola]